MQLHRPCIYPVAQFHGQGKHIHIRRHHRQVKMLVEQGVHQVSQFHIVLTVRLDHFAQAMLGQDQLPCGGILVVDVQHALLDQP
ncbi:hypothetical protein D3C71_1782930 [compost metagenome]